MKKQFLLCALAAASLSVFGDGLNQKFVPADARWILHLDGEAFRNSRIGAMIVQDKFESKVHEVEKDANTKFDFSFSKVSALTAYGPKVGDSVDKEGVLVVQTTADVKKDLEKLIAIKEAGSNGEPPISKVSDGDLEYYSIGDDLRLMPAGPGVWVIGKNKSNMKNAREVILGKAPALTDANFLKYPAANNGYFFMAFADTGSAVDRLPAQAKILQKAEGGRIVVGEKENKVFLNLSLRSKDSETLKQIQQLVQGLVAFAALSQSDNKDLQALANSTAISTKDDILSVDLSYPLDRAMEKVREMH